MPSIALITLSWSFQTLGLSLQYFVWEFWIFIPFDLLGLMTATDRQGLNGFAPALPSISISAGARPLVLSPVSISDVCMWCLLKAIYANRNAKINSRSNDGKPRLRKPSAVNKTSPSYYQSRGGGRRQKGQGGLRMAATIQENSTWEGMSLSSMAYWAYAPQEKKKINTDQPMMCCVWSYVTVQRRHVIFSPDFPLCCYAAWLMHSY